MNLYFLIYLLAGLPHGQKSQEIRKTEEKLRKNDKSLDKSGKNGVFEKSQVLSVQIYKIPYI